MNIFLFISILIVLMMIFATLVFMAILLVKNPTITPEPVFQKNEALEELVEILKEEKDNQIKEVRDRELMEYAYRNRRDVPSNIVSSIEQKDKPVNVRSRELVPFNLSSTEKRIWEEFNNS